VDLDALRPDPWIYLKPPKVDIDYEKCTVPLHCRRCLDVCPQAVFAIETLKVVKYQETDPQDPGAYKLKARFRDKCTACNECADVCPVGALKVYMP